MSRTVVLQHEKSESGIGPNEDIVALWIEALHGKDILSVSGNALHDNVFITVRDGTVIFNKTHRLQTEVWQNCVELETKKMSCIDSSDNYHVGLNQDGDVYTWKDAAAEGDISDLEVESAYLLFPKMLNISLRVVQISCGKKHSACLTEEGRIGVWGSNAEGQLGLGRKAGELYTEPQFVESLKEIMFIQVVAGGFHTMALTGSSAVFGWGRNSSRQLGSARKDKQMGPILCPDVRSKKIKFISCGEEHTAMLSNDGIVFSFGLNFQDDQSVDGEVPHGEIERLRGKSVSSVACGPDYTVTFVPDSWQAFVFARGRGQKEVILAHLIGEPDFHVESDIEIPRPTGSVLLMANNRTFLHVRELQTRDEDLMRETLDKMLLLDRINSDNSQHWSDEHLKRKLMVSLSSPSCVSGSFLSSDTRHGEHSGPKVHGIDMEAVTFFFRFLKDKCLGDESVSLTVREAWQKLISELPNDPCHVEALRLYLVIPFCHLMDDGSMIFLEPFANSWMRLDKNCQNILDLWLKKLPDEYFVRYLDILTKAVCELLPRFKDTFKDEKVIPTCEFSCVKLIEKLYKINKQRCDQTALNQWLKTLPIEFFTRYLEVFMIAVSQLLADFEDMNTEKTKIPKSVYLCVRVTERLFKISEERSDIKILNQWLTTLPFEYFKSYLEVLMKSINCKLIPKFKDLYRDSTTIPSIIHSAVGIVEKLYKINEERKDQVNWQAFYVPQLSSTINIHEDYTLSLKDLEQKGNSFRFCKFPFLYNPESKGVLLRLHNETTMNNAFTAGSIDRVHFFAFTVSRERLIKDTRQEIAKLQAIDEHIYNKELYVSFEGEKAGGQGVCQEFFTLLFDRLLQEDLFYNEEDSNLLWFKPQPLGKLELLKFMGFMLGLAVYNGKLIHLHFPVAMHKKLLDVPLTFSDFKELKPRVAKGLEDCILGDEIMMEVFFEDEIEREGKVVSKTLCENGDKRLVTLGNRSEYIDLKVDFQLNTSIEQEFEHFRRGFFEALDKTVLRDQKFQPFELQAVIVGKEQIDIREWKRTVRYGGDYHIYHPVIISLWKVLAALEIDDLKLFIRFITGTERIPHGGLDLLILPLEIENEDTYDLIPIVATCSNVLYLPSIENPDRLKNRLYHAIGNKENKDKNRFTSLQEALRLQP